MFLLVCLLVCSLVCLVVCLCFCVCVCVVVFGCLCVYLVFACDNLIVCVFIDACTRKGCPIHVLHDLDVNLDILPDLKDYLM